jgi:molybdopterin synthase catalytic subunit
MNIDVRLQREALDEGQARALVAAAGHGAVLVFSGVVRNVHEGLPVSAVDYSAYEPLARTELEAVAREAAAGLEIGSLALWHRLGLLQVGEVSVIVAVGSRHRLPALRCVERLMDLLKRRVPIWKQEHGPDGVRWVEGQLPPTR